MAVDTFDLTNISSLLEALWSADASLGDGQEVGQFDGTFCSRCGDYRRMKLSVSFNAEQLTREQVAKPWPEEMLAIAKVAAKAGRAEWWTFGLASKPALLVAKCVLCDATMTLVVTIVRGGRR